MTTPLKRREKWTRARSMAEVRGQTSELLFSSLALQFHGKQLLRAGPPHVVGGRDALGDEPAGVGGMIQGDFCSGVSLAAVIQHIDPGREAYTRTEIALDH